jgi:hypothetical protein
VPDLDVAEALRITGVVGAQVVLKVVKAVDPSAQVGRLPRGKKRCHWSRFIETKIVGLRLVDYMTGRVLYSRPHSGTDVVTVPKAKDNVFDVISGTDESRGAMRDGIHAGTLDGPLVPKGGGGSAVGIQGLGTRQKSSASTGAGFGKTPAPLGKKRSHGLGKIHIGSGTSTGFCKKSDVIRIIRRRAVALRACYERQLRMKPTLAGKVTVRWTIGLTGRVSRAAPTGNTLGDGAVTSCIMRVIRRMRFAKPEAGTCLIEWPLVFRAN